MLKKYFITVVIFIFALGIDRGHRYLYGAVEYIDSSKIILNGNEYYFTKNLKLLDDTKVEGLSMKQSTH